jgi:hypothetical protein
LFGNADVVIKVENDDGFVKIGFDKIRNAPPRDSLAFGLVQQDTGLTDTDGQPVVSAILRPASLITSRSTKLNPNYRKVLEVLARSIFADAGAKERQITEATQLEQRTVFRALSALKDRGYIIQGAKGDPYFITPAGRAQLGPVLAPAPRSTDSDDSGAVLATDTEDTASESPTDTTDSELTASGSQSADTQLPLTALTPPLGVSVLSVVSVKIWQKKPPRLSAGESAMAVCTNVLGTRKHTTNR